MSIKDDIHTALMKVAPTAPAKHSRSYTGKALEYFTYDRYDREGAAYAENKETDTAHFFQIDLWQSQGSTADLDSMAESAIRELEKIDFKGFSLNNLFEDETKIGHIAIRCNKTIERQ